MVAPAVYIGLGTSGAEIISGFQRHLFEEYGFPGLPCLRFLSLETDRNIHATGIDAYIRDQSPDWQRLQRISLCVSRQQLDELRGKIDPGSPVYHPGWDEWLQDDVLVGAPYESGARGWRMAGRMCLWAHWEEVRGLIQSAIEKANEGRKETVEILRNHYKSKGLQIPLDNNLVEQSLRVYICGSLCGGTGSSMFWEVGYIAQEGYARANINVNPSIHGLFTTVDRDVANTVNQSNVVHALNSYAAILEYDYWASAEQAYRIQHPVDARRYFPSENPNAYAPFQYLLLFSPSNQGGKRLAFHQGQRLDLSPLNAMISTYLYLELVPEVRNLVGNMRANYQMSRDWNAPSPKKHFRQCILSDGLSGFYYPKFLIASAAACQLIVDMLDRWTSAGDALAAQKAARTDWQAIYKDIYRRLILVENGNIAESSVSALRAELEPFIRQSLNALDRHFKDKAGITLAAEKLSLPETLNPDGALARIFQNKIHGLAKEAIDQISSAVQRRLNDIRALESVSLEETVVYIQELSVQIRKQIELLSNSSSLERFSDRWPEYDAIAQQYLRVQEDAWLRKGLSRHYRAILRNYITRAVDAICERVRLWIAKLADATMRAVCERVLSDLGGDRASEGFEQTIYDWVTTKQRRLREEVRPALKQKLEQATRDRVWGNLYLVTRRDSIEEDAKELAETIRRQIQQDRNRLFQDLLTDRDRSISFVDLLSWEADRIERKLLQVYLPYCLQGLSSRVSIHDQLLTDKLKAEIVLEVARGARPFLQFRGGVVPKRGCNTPDMLIGPLGSRGKLEQVLTRIDMMEADPHGFQINETQIDNMIVFFHEAAALSYEDCDLDETLDHLIKQGGYDSKEARSWYNNHFTHKRGIYLYHPVIRHQFVEMQFWLKVVRVFERELIERKFVKKQGESLTYQYRTRHGVKDDVDLLNVAEMQKFASAEDGQYAEQFLLDLQNELKSIPSEAIQNKSEELEALDLDRNELKEIREICTQVMKRLFPQQGAAR